MKKWILCILIACSANELLAQTIKTLKQVIKLQMPKTADDDMCGTRGAAVAWHPIQKKYYAVFAGNTEYPMAVFNVTGKRLSNEDLIANIDTRGLWYNTATKQLCGNGYNDKGWFIHELDANGIPKAITSLNKKMFQPNDQSVGVWHAKKQKALFYNEGVAYLYNLTDSSSAPLTNLQWGKKATDAAATEDENANEMQYYNETTLVYTALPNSEIGALNTNAKQIELYNETTGFLTQVLKLPNTAKAESLFNFAYANGIYWLFDMENRTWVGYK
jgi:hypothetical protein